MYLSITPTDVEIRDGQPGIEMGYVPECMSWKRIALKVRQELQPPYGQGQRDEKGRASEQVEKGRLRSLRSFLQGKEF